jgi:hypothetical protein
MKILIVTSEIIKNKYSASIRTVKIIQKLSKKYEVDVITEPMSIWNFNHNIKTIYLTNYSNKVKHYNSLQKKILSKFFYINLVFKKRLKAFLKTIKKLNTDQYDYILALGGGDFFVPHEALSKIKTKAKIIGYIHDPYPMDLYPEPYKVISTKRSSVDKERFKKILHRLNIIAFPSKLLGESMNDYYKFGKRKISILPHLLPELNRNNFNENEVNKFFLEQNILKGKYYLHAGTLLKHRVVHEIINQFKSLKQTKELSSDFKLLFIGGVNYKIQESDEDVVFIKNRLNLELINGISHYAQALLIVEHISDFSPFLPGKLPECVAHEKPVMHFGPLKSETCRVINEFMDIEMFSAKLDDPVAIKKVLKEGGINLSENKDLVNYFTIDGFMKTLEK